MPRRAVPFALLALAACAAPQGEFPSLAVRPIEGRSDAIAPPAPPAPADPATVVQTARLGAEVDAGRAAFTDALPVAQRAVASSGARGGERWIAAQLALTRLDRARARTVDALAALDRLLVADYGAERTVPAETVALTERARDQAEAQAQAIAALKARVAPAD